MAAATTNGPTFHHCNNHHQDKAMTRAHGYLYENRDTIYNACFIALVLVVWTWLCSKVWMVRAVTCMAGLGLGVTALV